MPPRLSDGILFVPGLGTRKYKAILPNGRSVSFGHRSYMHFRDSTPAELGGQLWSHLNHNDKFRRSAYRKRHGQIRLKDGTLAIHKRYSPAWFSYHFLW